MLRARTQSRLHEQGATVREVHRELDSIEARLASLRERQATFLFDTAVPEAQETSVDTIDLRSVAQVDATPGEPDRGTSKPEQVSTTDTHEDDFEKRLAAFAASENEDSFERWLEG